MSNDRITIPPKDGFYLRKSKNLGILVDLSSLLTDFTSPEDLLNKSLDLLLERLGYFAGRVYLMDKDKKSLSLVALKGISKDRLEKVGLSDSFTGLSATTKTLISKNVESLEDVHRRQLLKEKGIKQVICVPLLFNNETIGVLNLASKRPKKLKPGYVDVLSAVANQLSIAIVCGKALYNLKERTIELERNQEKLKFLAYSISHDLKNPLIAMIGLLQRMAKLLTSDQLEKLSFYVRHLETTCHTIYQLVQDLNSYINASELPVCFEYIDIKAMIKEIGIRFDTELVRRKINLSISDEIPLIMGDKGLLQRVFQNLLDNSLKYGGNGLTRIEVGYKKEGDEHIFWVKDNGVGLKPQELHNLFDPFQRKSSAIGTEGSGLGLAIVKTIVERHGGRVWAEIPIDGGIVFYFSLPQTPLVNE